LVNRIQNIRKDSGFEVTDKIRVEIELNDATAAAVESFAEYIAQQTLAVEVKAVAEPQGEKVVDTELDEATLKIAVSRV
jgi:isoleucyl-tRNA synthetase